MDWLSTHQFLLAVGQPSGLVDPSCCLSPEKGHDTVEDDWQALALSPTVLIFMGDIVGYRSKATLTSWQSINKADMLVSSCWLLASSLCILNSSSGNGCCI